MYDLTLAEALKLYPEECREVLGTDQYRLMVQWVYLAEKKPILLGSCLCWLGGKPIQYLSQVDCYWPEAPLRFMLDEVRAHMQATKETTDGA